MGARKYNTTTITGDGRVASFLFDPGRRLFIVFGLFCVLTFAILVRLFFMQSVHYERYADKGLRQHTSERALLARRGSISIKDAGELYPIAVNREYFRAFVSEPDVDDEQKNTVATQIAGSLSVDAGDVLAKLSKEGDLYEVIARKITKERMEELREEKIPGLHFEPEIRRFYPGDSLGAHVVGFVGSDGENTRGRYGVESSFEGELRGEAGLVEEFRDARGGWNSVMDRAFSPEQDGKDMILTIERSLQQSVEKILAEDTEKYDAERGSAIVMEVGTGKIIAMAQVPTFSLNEYGQVDDLSLFSNIAVSDAYESGSVFKTFTLAMGLDAGVITPGSTYDDKGFVKADVFTIRNSEDKVYGVQTMTKILEDSINTGVVHVEKLLGNSAFKEYAEQFGFGERTGIELPVEAAGDLNNLSNLRRTVEFYTASFGQGITVTPLQLVVAYGALANNGMMMQPYIVDRVISSDGGEHVNEPHEKRRVISEKASEEISEMLYQVVAGGHAKLADVPGYRVGGKTGTAQVVNSETGKYDEEKKNTTFVGYAPIAGPNDPETIPEYVVLVRYDNPRAVEWAATSASPTFGRIMKSLLDFRDIPPTEEIIFEDAIVPENVID